MTWTDPRAVFITPHPDDEVLSLGVAIANHVAAGRDVHVVAVTQGGASGVRGALNGTAAPAPWWGVQHNPVQEGYAPLDVADFEAARVAELLGSCAALGVQAGNIHVYDLPDGAVTVADVRAIISADFAWSGASYKSTCYRWDFHPDHLAVGQALRELHAEEPAVWGDVRYYLMRKYWTTADPDPATFYEAPSSPAVKQRVINACRAYSGWAPALGHYAVGYQSTADYFTELIVDVRGMVVTS